MALSDEAITRAEEAMRAEMAAGHRAVAARYDRRRSRIVVRLDSGLELTFPAKLAEDLENAAPSDLAVIEISPTGLGLHWPRIDADLYLPALLNGILGSPRWMAGLMGRKGGQSRSAAKGTAARANGQRGGRPRKTAG
jgi:hypothetical protein